MFEVLQPLDVFDRQYVCDGASCKAIHNFLTVVAHSAVQLLQRQVSTQVYSLIREYPQRMQADLTCVSCHAGRASESAYVYDMLMAAVWQVVRRNRMTDLLLENWMCRGGC